VCKINYLERAICAPDIWLAWAEWLPFKVFHRNTGLATHTHNTNTHTHTRMSSKDIMYRLHFVQHRFLVLWHPNVDSHSPHTLGFFCFCVCICMCVCIYIYTYTHTCIHTYIFLSLSLFSFLTIISIPSLNIIVQELVKNQTLHMNRAGQGMLSFSGLCCPFKVFLWKLYWFLEAKQWQGSCGSAGGDPYLLPGPPRLYISYRKVSHPLQ
jgi:hypothetical protein